MPVKNDLPPIHPGVFLKEILDELAISQNAFAHAIGVSSRGISHIIMGNRPVTAELALLFGKAFSQTPTYWMNLQTTYDLKTTEAALAEKLSQVQPLTEQWDEQISSDIAQGKLDALAAEALLEFQKGATPL